MRTTTRGSAQAGAIVWVDLSTPDVERATTFYEGLLGWQHEELATPMGAYVVARAGSGDVAGIMAQPPEELAQGIPTRWVIFVGSDDLEATLARARQLGGSVLQPPLALPNGSRVAAVADPAGAALGLLEGPPADHPLGRDERGTVVWVECLSRDVAASRAFHEDLFGWKTEEGTGGYFMFNLDAVPIAGLMAMPAMVPPSVPSVWSVYFAVDDIDEACERAAALGGSVIQPPHEIDEGCFAVLADPLGATFYVFKS